MINGFLRAAKLLLSSGRLTAFGVFLILCYTPGHEMLAQGRLEIIVQNIDPLRGTIRVALYNREERFMKEHFQIREVKAFSNNTSIFFDNLPAGDYAFSIFHDINDNGELDTNFLGIPREPWGFSNNARGRFGPPGFGAAKFRVEGHVVMKVMLNR